MEKYEKIKQIGEGAYATTYLVINRQDNQFYAMKQLSTTDVCDEEIDSMIQETVLQQKFDHPNIIKYVESERTPDSLLIIQEYADMGCLSDILQEQQAKGHFTEDELLHYFVQILLGIKHVHDKNILHRDLKGENILLKSNITNPQKPIVKIADFGFSRALDESNNKAFTFAGTPIYMSPEIFQGQGYDSKTDIWSLGCLLYHLCSFEQLQKAKNMQALLVSIQKNKKPNITNYYSQDLQNILNVMLQDDPNQRADINQLLAMPVLSKHIKELLPAEVYKETFVKIQNENEFIPSYIIIKYKILLIKILDIQQKVKQYTIKPLQFQMLQYYTRIRELGSGEFGTTYLVQNPQKQLYAMKIIKLENKEESEIMLAKQEVSVQQKFNHQNIIKFIESDQIGSQLIIVQEYANKGNLANLIQQQKLIKNFTEDEILHYFVQILLGVKHIHDRNALHRDIKGENLLLHEDSLNPQLLHVKITDFGLSRVADETGQAITFVGTPIYMSPEIFQGQKYNNKTDIWSLGCLLYHMCTFENLYYAKTMQTLVKNVLNNIVPDITNKYSSNIQHLLNIMLQKNPIDRPNINQLFELPFINQLVPKLLTKELIEREFYQMMHIFEQ